MLYAFFFAAYGMSLLTAEPSQSTAWRDTYAPPVVWACAWFVLSAVAAGFAFSRRDALGYGISILMMSGWTFLAFASWALGEVSRGWVMGVLFILPTLILAVDSGRAEPPPEPPIGYAPTRPPEST